MNELIVYCDGGFGNRFNALVSGLLLARRTGRRARFVWPVNNWCGAAFGDLFDMDLPVVERELATFVAERDRHTYLMVEDRLGLSGGQASGYTNPMQMPSWQALEAFFHAARAPVFYYTALVPGFISETEVLSQVRQLRFRPGLVARAEHFLASQGLGASGAAFVGIQIRKTDFGTRGADDATLFDIVRAKENHRFFVCSDDAEVERRFAQLPNVVIHRKRAHVEKLVEGGWNAQTTDHSGRLYPFNVNRSAASVEDALVDLLILSCSTIVNTSGSTFLQTAMRIQASGLRVHRAEAASRPSLAAVGA